MNIEIKNLSDALNPFNKNIISEELDNYIIKQCNFQKKKNIEIIINGKLSKEEKIQMENIIHNYYNEAYKRLKIVDKYDDYFRLFALFVGILLILISEQLISFFSEFFLIFGWILIWEMLYDILLYQLKRKKKANIYYKLSHSKITFK